MVRLNTGLYLILSFILFSLSSLAGKSGSDYHSSMLKAVSILDTADHVSSFIQLSKKFTSISEKYPEKWLPFYYLSYCQTRHGRNLKNNKDKDEFYQNALQSLEKAQSINPDNSEILTLKAFIYLMIIEVNPIMRGTKFGHLSDKLLERAKELDPDNPRPWYLHGESLLHRPAFFGGGTKEACPQIKIALEKFRSYEVQSNIQPHWGHERAMELMDQCN